MRAVLALGRPRKMANQGGLRRTSEETEEDESGCRG
jgi:hypothetical protein